MRSHLRRLYAAAAAVLLVGLFGVLPVRADTVVGVTVREGTWMAIAVSPDASRVVIDLQGGLWVLPMSGGTAQRITDELLDARQPAWSPDGTRIAFQGYGEGGGWQIWTVHADGSAPTALTSGWYDHQEPHWSPDGTQIVFSSERSGEGHYDIWIVDVATRELRRLTTDPSNEFYPVWSPDGQAVAYVSTRPEAPGVYASTLTGEERLLTPSSGELGGPSWSPDGKILFSVVEGDRARTSAATQTRLVLDGQPIATGEDYFPFRAHWLSADEFLYPADGKIKRRSVKEGVRPPVEFSATLDVRRPEYTRKRRDFDSVEPNRALGIVRPVMAPDGQTLAFGALGDVWMARPGATPQQVTDDVFADTDPAWSPDGTQLAFASDRAGDMDIWVRDLRTSRDRRLTSMPNAEVAPAWSPDGTQIAFVNRTAVYTSELFVVAASGGEPRSVNKGAVFGYPSWGRDGTFLIVATVKPYTSRRREGVNYYSIVPTDGGPATLVVPKEHEPIGKRAAGAALSPDGKHLAFIRHAYLFVLPVGPDGRRAGEARQLTTELADSVSWAGPDQLLYIATDRLKLVSLADGRTRDIPLDLTWTRQIPQGRLVVHAERLIDGLQPAARPNMDLVIEKNRIVAIEPHRPALHTGRVIDATGQSVMPGLIDGHVHTMRHWGTRFGRIYLAYGVTAARQLADVPYDTVEEREAIEAGRRPGPRLYTTGYLLGSGGGRINFQSSTSVPSEAVLDLELERARRLEYDLLKTYIYLPIPLQKRAIEGAHRIGIPTSSHDIYPAARYGTDSVEHTRAHDRRAPTSSKRSPLGRAYEDVIQIVAKSGMSFTPTLSLHGFWSAVAENPALASDRRMQLQLPFVMERVAAGPGRGSSPSSRQRPEWETVLKLYRAGATVIAGIDAPAIPYAVALHVELQDYVAAGLTPFEALRTATTNTASVLGAAAELGTLETGKLADIVIVDGNPLTNIADTMNVRTVIKNGEVYTPDQLIDLAPSPVTSR